MMIMFAFFAYASTDYMFRVVPALAFPRVVFAVPTQFFAAIMGNLTSVTAIFMRATSKADLMDELPFIPGQAGTLLFDLTVIIQFSLYGRAEGDAAAAGVGEAGSKQGCGGGAGSGTTAKGPRRRGGSGGIGRYGALPDTDDGDMSTRSPSPIGMEEGLQMSVSPSSRQHAV